MYPASRVVEDFRHIHSVGVIFELHFEPIRIYTRSRFILIPSIAAKQIFEFYHLLGHLVGWPSIF